VTAVAREDGKHGHHDRADVAEEEQSIQHARHNAPLLGGPRCCIFCLQASDVGLE